MWPYGVFPSKHLFLGDSELLWEAFHCFSKSLDNKLVELFHCAAVFFFRKLCDWRQWTCTRYWFGLYLRQNNCFWIASTKATELQILWDWTWTHCSSGVLSFDQYIGRRWRRFLQKSWVSPCFWQTQSKC